MNFQRNIIISLLLLMVSPIIFAQKNTLKFHTTPLAWGEIRLGYERKISKALSLQFNYGGFFSDKIPSFIYDIETVEDYTNTYPTKNKLSGFSTSIDLRISPTLNSLHKFYIAPYIKYNRYDFLVSASFEYEANAYEYANLTTEQQNVGDFYTDGNYYFEATGNLNGTVTQYGIGASIGWQFIIAKVICIDINPIGIGIEYDNIQADLTTNIDVDYDKWLPYVKDDIKDIPYIGNKVELTAESDKIKMKAPLILPTYRGSISIGFAF